MTAVRSVTGDASGVKRKRTAERAVVVVQRGRLAAAGEEQLAAPVVVAVEGGHAAADEVLEVSGVPVVDGAGLLDEVRCSECRVLAAGVAWASGGMPIASVTAIAP